MIYPILTTALVLSSSVETTPFDTISAASTAAETPDAYSQNLLEMGWSGYAGCLQTQLLGRVEEDSDAAMRKLVGQTPAEAEQLVSAIISACSPRKAAITTELTDLIRQSRKGKFLAVDPVEFHLLKIFSDELAKMDRELLENLQRLQRSTD